MEDVSEDRKWVRRLLGLEPPELHRPTAVRRRALGPFGSIAMERIEVDTSDDDTIPCLLLRPEAPVRNTVIAVHQHAGEFSLGKSELAGLCGDPSMAYGLRLAEHGVRVLIPDLLGFEERQRGWTTAGADDEQLDALLRIAQGSSLQAKHTKDIAALTTWLVDEPEMTGNLGIMGHSLGGQVALFSLAFDARLSAGVVSCGVGTVASFASHRIKHNPAWFVPGLTAAGDVPAVARALEGQRALVSAGSADPWFPIDGVRAVLEGFGPGICNTYLFDGRHELPAELLELASSHFVDAIS
ncbi:dienelactone hydrolase family protein [Arthrobacter sp. FW306-04-A]|uniref:dienelactone hydrolase family protein n=1 Tax=Arthrobacter sp. FW306-04-A TaxID=2879619 RepID=UPI0037C0610C|nr:dienelactone hydrolase family protein [Arthrobacter sp. FW306-04-A]